MSILRLRYDFEGYNKLHLIPLADPQIGEPEFDEKALLGYRDWILNNDDAFTGLMGDWFSSYVLYNRAVNFWEMALKPEECLDKAVAILEPIKDRILWVDYGNHSERAYRLTGKSMLEDLVRALDLKKYNLLSRRGTLINLKVGSVLYSVYSLHGWGGARTTGGQINKVKEMGKVVPRADVYLQGHEHSLIMSRGDSFKTDSGIHRAVYVVCGAFCGYTGFQAGLARELPNIGAPRIRLNGERRDVHVSI